MDQPPNNFRRSQTLLSENVANKAQGFKPPITARKPNLVMKPASSASQLNTNLTPNSKIQIGLRSKQHFQQTLTRTVTDLNPEVSRRLNSQSPKSFKTPFMFKSSEDKKIPVRITPAKKV